MKHKLQDHTSQTEATSKAKSTYWNWSKKMPVVWRSCSCPAAIQCFEGVSLVGFIAEMNLAAYKHLGWLSLSSLPYFFSYLMILQKPSSQSKYGKPLEDKKLTHYRVHSSRTTTNSNPKDNPEDKPGDNKNNFWASRANPKTNLKTNLKASMTVLTQRNSSCTFGDTDSSGWAPTCSARAWNNCWWSLSALLFCVLSRLVIEHVCNVWSLFFDLLAPLQKMVFNFWFRWRTSSLVVPTQPSASGCWLSPAGWCSSSLYCAFTGPTKQIKE